MASNDETCCLLEQPHEQNLVITNLLQTLALAARTNQFRIPSTLCTIDTIIKNNSKFILPGH